MKERGTETSAPPSKVRKCKQYSAVNQSIISFFDVLPDVLAALTITIPL